MQTNFKLSAILLCLVLAGCIETSQQSLTENKSLANSLALDDSNPNARQGGGSTGQIYLSVTIADNLKIASDKIVPYVNGVDGVSAQFVSSDGSLSFTTSTTRIKNPRKLIFPDGANYAINPNSSNTYLLNVLANDVHPAPYKIQDIPEGTSQVMAMRIWGSNLSGAVEFRLIFNYGIGAGYITDQVIVTRVDSTTWTVESTDTDESNPNATAALTGSYNKDLRGYYSVPFKLTLTKIN